MQHTPHTGPAAAWPGTADGRSGDVGAMLRVMEPLAPANDAAGQRRLFADLCRLIGKQYGALPDPAPPPAGAAPDAVVPPLPARPVPAPADDLSPRAAEVLRHLLDGDGEKQVARRLGLSRHTVHGHVKVLYRRFGVSSRAELLARHVRRDPPR